MAAAGASDTREENHAPDRTASGAAAPRPGPRGVLALAARDREEGDTFDASRGATARPAERTIRIEV